MRLRVLLAVLILISASSLGAWTNTRGNGERTGTTNLPGALDILAVVPLHDETELVQGITGSTILPWRDGIVTFTSSPDGCTLIVIEDWQEFVSDQVARYHQIPADVCQEAWLSGIDPETDTVFWTVVGPLNGVQADWKDREFLFATNITTGEHVTSWSANDIASHTPWPALASYSGDGPTMIPWDVAIDLDRRFMVFGLVVTETIVDYYTHRIISIDLDDYSIDWTSSVTNTQMAAAIGDSAVIDDGNFPADDAYANFAPIGLAIGESAIFTSGFSVCFEFHTQCGGQFADDGRPSPIYGTLAWHRLDDGSPLGAYTVGTSASNPTAAQSPTIGRLGAAPTFAESRAVLLLDDTLVSANEGRASAATWQMPQEEREQGLRWTNGAVTNGKLFFVPTYNGIYATVNGAWSEPLWEPALIQIGGGAYNPELLLGDDELLAAWTHGDEDGQRTKLGEPWFESGILTRHDLATGATLQELPLPLWGRVLTTPFVATAPLTSHTEAEPLIRWGTGIDMAPLRDGNIAISSGTGTLVIVGPANGTPTARVSAAYPAIGEELQITVPPAPTTKVAWEPGVIDASNSTSFSHTYESGGVRTILVTQVFADGTTKTSSYQVDVGGSRQTVIDKMFSPDNEETTWGIIGLAAIVVGSIFGLWARRRGRGRVRRGLQRIEAAKEGDPVAALNHLSHLSRDFNEGLLDGRLTEDQHRVLTHRAAATMQKLGRVVLAPILAKAGQDLRDLVWAVLVDDEISHAEVQAVNRLAAHDTGLAPQQKRQLSNVLAAWRGEL